jgi:hypothetical protein
MKHPLLTVTALWMLAVASSNGQTIEQIAFWKKTVSEKPLTQIANAMSNTTGVPWPIASSAYRVQAMPAAQRPLAQEATSLVKALHGKVREDFEGSSSDRDAMLEAYLGMVASLDKAGGYSNMLLADAIRKLVIFRVSEWLTKGVQPVAKAETVMDRLNVPVVNLRAVLERLIPEDAVLSEHREQVEKLTPEQNIFAAAEAIGSDWMTLTSAHGFTELIEKPSALALTMRMAQTELLATVSIRGLIAFLKKGGTYQELNPADITAFQKRMAGSEKSFRYLPLGVRYLSVSHPRSLFELHSDPAARKVYMQAALN